jgi:serine phosphatase RsbU (regulator of sigma subunit)
MTGQLKNKLVQNWSEIISDSDSPQIKNPRSGQTEDGKVNIVNLAEYFYTDIWRVRNLCVSPFTLNKDFRKLSEVEKQEWYAFVSRIPGKLKSLNLFIRNYRDFCRTCLIHYYEIENMARSDYEAYCNKLIAEGRIDHPEKKSDINLVPFQDLTDEKRRFYIEMNHLIPVELKKIGFEIIRPEEVAEINEKMVNKLARAIHSRYLHEVRKQQTSQGKHTYLSWVHKSGEGVNQNLTDFEDLDAEIKSSNLDNAYHIPAKLLAIGYKIRPVKKGFRPAALHLNNEEVETMARVEHVRWCWDKILKGWLYGNVKDSKKKLHSSIIPYEELSESEKEKDRELVRLIPALLQDIDYAAYPVNPDRISKLPYAIKPHSSINKILEETRQMNDQIRKMVKLSARAEEMVSIRNSKIEDAIREIESSYNYALHIQETFLPDDLFVRECFPESFILFKPKDIVSGDFYFFSKQGKKIIFAAADCTGHGIPGALLSTIGYGTLDQAVNELKLVKPSEILVHLYSKVHRFLRHDDENAGVIDDLDIALCSYDIESNLLIYSGVGRPLYRITNDEIIEYKSENLIKECDENSECGFTEENILLKSGDSVYLCSDGYADQFGGKFHKRYQRKKLKNLLLSIRDYSMPEQSDKLYEEFEQWREENNEDQLDDILVIGIKI